MRPLVDELNPRRRPVGCEPPRAKAKLVQLVQHLPGLRVERIDVILRAMLGARRRDLIDIPDYMHNDYVMSF